MQRLSICGSRIHFDWVNVLSTRSGSIAYIYVQDIHCKCHVFAAGVINYSLYSSILTTTHAHLLHPRLPLILHQ